MDLHEHADRVYRRRLEAGVAREQARKDLPLSTYTEAYWKIDLHNLLHFLSLRMDSHAQLEIRSYANVIGEIFVSALFPLVWEAFKDYRLNAMYLTHMEHQIIGFSLSGQDSDAYDVAHDAGWMERKENGTFKSNRERQEAEAKFQQLNFDPPWVVE